MTDERREDLGITARRRQLDARLTPGLVLAVLTVVVVVGSVFGVALWLNQDDRENAEMGSCQRVQYVRDQTNRNAAIVYLVLHEAARAAGTRDPDTATEYRRYANATRYTAPTNCPKAVNDPLHYVAPRPEPFTRALAVTVLLATARPTPG